MTDNKYSLRLKEQKPMLNFDQIQKTMQLLERLKKPTKKITNTAGEINAYLEI
jgi:hypothetical protein